MKQLIAIVAAVATLTAFAAEPAKTAVAPAPTASAPAPIKTADCGTKSSSQGCGKDFKSPTIAPAPVAVTKDPKAETAKK